MLRAIPFAAVASAPPPSNNLPIAGPAALKPKAIGAMRAMLHQAWEYVSPLRAGIACFSRRGRKTAVAEVVIRVVGKLNARVAYSSEATVPEGPRLAAILLRAYPT